MVIELIRTVNYFAGIFQQPIKLEISATSAAVDPGAAVDNDSLAVIRIIRIDS